MDSAVSKGTAVRLVKTLQARAVMFLPMVLVLILLRVTVT